MNARARSWEDLRREARKLESELDVRVAQYAKMCTSSGGLGEQQGGGGVGGSGNGEKEQTKQAAVEIEALLEKLSDVNAAMGSAATGGADSRAHTLARHRDILTDFSQEFRRLSAASAHLQSRVALFGTSTSGSSAAGAGTGGQEEGDHVALNIGGSSSNYSLLRERSTIYGAQERMDEVIGSAQATMGSIVQQRGLFTDIHGKINTIGAKFPVLNNIMGSIRRKKSKDTIILATVVCGCTLFLLIYWFSK